jgi:hypothetical protein
MIMQLSAGYYWGDNAATSKFAFLACQRLAGPFSFLTFG